MTFIFEELRLQLIEFICILMFIIVMFVVGFNPLFINVIQRYESFSKYQIYFNFFLKRELESNQHEGYKPTVVMSHKCYRYIISRCFYKYSAKIRKFMKLPNLFLFFFKFAIRESRYAIFLIQIILFS
jgi:hypothetical protein